MNCRLKLDETRSRPEAETVQLFGKDWDLAAGRVLLIDFTIETPVVSQKNVSLPKDPRTPEFNLSGRATGARAQRGTGAE